MRHATIFFIGLVGSLAPKAPAQVPDNTYVNFEGAQTNPVRLSPSGQRLLAVNTADSRLSVFDVSQPFQPVLMAEIPVGLEPVSVNARTDDEVWVVNHLSDSISIVSVSRRLVIDTVQVKDEPADVVFVNDRAFVSVSRNNEIRVFDVRTRAHLKTIPVFGGNPRALAATSAGKVYAAFALSGNRSTIIPLALAPKQPPPTNTALPNPPDAALIVDAEDRAWQWAINFRMPDNDVVEIDARTMTVSRYFSRLGTINLGLAVRPFTNEIYVANTEAHNKERFEPVLRARFVQNRVSRVRPLGGGRTIWELNGDQPTRETSLAQPAAMVFDPLGRFLFVAAFGTDRVGVLNPDTGAVLARIPVGPVTGAQADPRNKRGPRGLALHSLSPVLYVLNRISNTVSVVNTQTLAEVTEIPVGSFDPTTAVIRNGRGFLYDAKLSGNGSASCAACHVDADMDMLAWDLGNPGGDMSYVDQAGAKHAMHPMKGPMTTQSLRGLADSLPLHWRGDRADFNAFNGAFSSLMGGSALPDEDMNAFTAFINTIRYMPNPNQNLDRTLPDSFNGGNPKAGLATFLFDPYRLDIRCQSCHFSTPGAGTSGFIQNFEGQDQPMKVAQLRNVYQKTYFTPVNGGQSIGGFGLLNDGSMPNIFVLLSQQHFRRFSNDTVKKRNISAFVMCFDTGTAPAVGYSRTVRADNVNDPGLAGEWIMLQLQAAAGNIDLIAKGMIGGQLTGLLYRPPTADYVPDTQAGSPLTRTQLMELIRQGGTLTVMGVPPGSGRRIGIDRDMDGIPDQDDQ